MWNLWNSATISRHKHNPPDCWSWFVCGWRFVKIVEGFCGREPQSVGQFWGNGKTSVSVVYKADSQRQRESGVAKSTVTKPQSQTKTRQARICVHLVYLYWWLTRLEADLNRQFTSYDNVNQHFGFLNNVLSLTPEVLRVSATKL